MDAIILGIFSFLMVLLCIVLVLFVLMQKPNSDGGMGASLGGGAAESAFGGEASNVLTRFTVKAVVLYFVLAFCLYLGYIYASSSTPKVEEKTTTDSVLNNLSKAEVAPVAVETTVEETVAPTVETAETVPALDVTAISEIDIEPTAKEAMPEATAPATESPEVETAE